MLDYRRGSDDRTSEGKPDTDSRDRAPTTLTDNEPSSNTHVFEKIEVGSDCLHIVVSTNKRLLNVRDATIHDRTISISGDMMDDSVQKALTEGRAILLRASEREQVYHTESEEFVKRNGGGQKLGS